jgi:hypothetical protein
MIFHFMKQDFKSNTYTWIAILLGAIVTLFIRNEFADAVEYYVGMSFLFALIVPAQFTGVPYRNQHVMSRNYLLSLPIKRTRLHDMIVLRSFIYFIPLLVAITVFPLNSPKFLLALHSLPLTTIEYGLMVVVFAAWINSGMIIGQLLNEKIRKLTNRNRRIGFLLLYVIAICFDLAVLTGSIAVAHSFLLPVSIMIVAIAIKYTLGRMMWVKG